MLSFVAVSEWCQSPVYKNCNSASKAPAVAADQVAMQKKPERTKDGGSQSSIVLSKQTLMLIPQQFFHLCAVTVDAPVKQRSWVRAQNATRTAPEAASSS